MKVKVEVIWTRLDTTCTIASSSWYPTEAEAWAIVLPSLQQDGWTYPLWWQFWRWADTRPSLEYCLTR